MDTNKIILKNKELHIKDRKGRTLLYADDNKIKLDLRDIHFEGWKFFFFILTSSMDETWESKFDVYQEFELLRFDLPEKG